MKKKVAGTDMVQETAVRMDHGTGAHRSIRPIYFDRLPPCNHACPAGENIQAWLAHVVEGRLEEAWRELTQMNPMPAVHGRVCYHPCEDACNRAVVDETISIHAVERYLGDLALEKGWKFRRPEEKSGKRVLIVGAGPSGLSAACHLSRLGHDVTIHEAGPMAGGMMHFGIPKYRLPREVLDAEIARIIDLGITLVLNHKVIDLQHEKKAGCFDAVFVAVGAHLGKRTSIPARDASKILDAVTFLRDVEAGNAPKLGRRVAIYGGGNTAMDAARTARRLGASEALIVYRRDRDHMPAHDFEADEVLEEGIKIHWLRTIKSFDDGGAGGQTSLEVEVMELDAKGYPQPTGRIERLEADAIILALGQDTDTEFLRKVPGVKFQKDGTVEVDPHMMTGALGVFAGGDMVPSERTVTIAVGHGRKAAQNIHAFLRGTPWRKKESGEPVRADALKMWYYAEAEQRKQSRIDISKRTTSFQEVVGGLDAKAATYEARRCLSCGNCFVCDGCLGACPENAIVKLGPGKRYRFNYTLCTGCAVCYEQCPSGAIRLIPEPNLKPKALETVSKGQA